MAEPFKDPSWFQRYARPSFGSAQRVIVRNGEINPTEEEKKKEPTLGETFLKGNVFGIAEAIFGQQLNKSAPKGTLFSTASKGLLVGIFLGAMMAITYLSAQVTRQTMSKLGI